MNRDRTWNLLRFKQWLPALAGLALLTWLYTRVGWTEVARAVESVSPAPLLLALLLFVPQTLISALRWRVLVAGRGSITMAQAIGDVLRAAVWNLILPSKLGDFAKRGGESSREIGPRATVAGFVMFEKLADVAALATLALWASSWFAPLRWWLPTVGLIAAVTLSGWLASAESRGRRALAVSVLSLVLWSLHLLQFDLFFQAAGVYAPTNLIFARVPLAIFAGLLPLTSWGIGTRDAALIWLFADSAPAAAMAVVGGLAPLRYLVPGLFGLVALRLITRPSLTSGRMAHVVARTAGTMPTGVRTSSG